MSDFSQAFEWMLPHEGGFNIDNGGRTKFGISQRQYPALDIENLTIAEAEEIYRRDYWIPNRFGAIDSQRIANKAFDMAVNMGSGSATKILQQACTACGWRVPIDGKMGPQTLNAINGITAGTLMDQIKAMAAAHYEAIADHNPELKIYLKGWIKRAAYDSGEVVASVLGGAD
jgi:lysozyme family protein